MLERFWGFFFIHKENQRMNYNDYQRLFSEILNGNITDSPYTDPHYLDYVKLNESRQNRWLKTGKLSTETRSTIQSIATEQHWLLITEPWCGDAAQLLPIFNKMSLASEGKIEMKIVLRDEHLELMDHFLTNNARAIPKLIVIDKNTYEALAHWGPRPKGAVELIQNYKKQHGVVDETAKADLQLWYLHDKGVSTQNEILDIMLSLEQ